MTVLLSFRRAVSIGTIPPTPPPPPPYHFPLCATAVQLRSDFVCPTKSLRAGLELDHKKAFELHLQAANMNMPRAQYNTAVHYLEGTGIEQVGSGFRLSS